MSSASTPIIMGPYETELNVLGWLTGAPTCVVGTRLPSTVDSVIYVDHVSHLCDATHGDDPTGYTSTDVCDIYGLEIQQMIHERTHDEPRVKIYSDISVGGGPFSSEVEKYVGELISVHTHQAAQPVLVSVVYRSCPTLRDLSARLEEAFGDDVTIVWGFSQSSPSVLYNAIRRGLSAGHITVLLCDTDSWGGYRHLVAAMAGMWKFPISATTVSMSPVTSVVIETNYVKTHVFTHGGFRLPAHVGVDIESIDAPADIHIGYTLHDRLSVPPRTPDTGSRTEMQRRIRADLMSDTPAHTNVTPEWYRRCIREMSARSATQAGWAAVYLFLTQLENPSLNRRARMRTAATYTCPVQRFLYARGVELQLRTSTQTVRNCTLKKTVKVAQFYTASRWFSVVLNELVAGGDISEAAARWIRTASPDEVAAACATVPNTVARDLLETNPELSLGWIRSSDTGSVVQDNVSNSRYVIHYGDAWGLASTNDGTLVLGSVRTVRTASGDIPCIAGLVRL